MTLNEWDICKLRDICTYSTERIKIEKVDLENYISTENMISEKKGITLATSIPNVRSVISYSKGDILISNIRPYFKKIWYADKDGGASNDVLVFKCNKKIVNNKYIYYYLSQDGFFNYVMATSKGTKMPRGDKDAILKYNINLPSIIEQNKIANILSSLDEKIETNNQINKKLEEMSQDIFKEWFVDFEFPNEDGESYKSSGGEMVESELGMIPKGWKVVELGDLVEIIDNRGKTPPQENKKTSYPIIDVKALSGNSRIIDYNNCMKYVSKETYENWFRNGHPKEGDILISTVGSLAEMKIFYGKIGCIAQNVVALRTKDISNLYLYQQMKYIKNELISYNIGSVQPSIKVTHIIKHKLIKPNMEIISRYHNIVNKLTEKIYDNFLEVENLSKVRELLLPKLMSGEIRVLLDN